MKKAMILIGIVVAIAIGLVLTVYILRVRKPLKIAVKLDEIDWLSCYILVQEDFTTGTGWKRLSDPSGYVGVDGENNIWLEGDLPPTISSYAYKSVNTFLCKVEELEDAEFSPSVPLKSYKVLEWNPVYPVKRYRMFLPEWIYPKEYMNYYDLMGKEHW